MIFVKVIGTIEHVRERNGEDFVYTVIDSRTNDELKIVTEIEAMPISKDLTSDMHDLFLITGTIYEENLQKIQETYIKQVIAKELSNQPKGTKLKSIIDIPKGEDELKEVLNKAYDEYIKNESDKAFNNKPF